MTKTFGSRVAMGHPDFASIQLRVLLGRSPDGSRTYETSKNRNDMIDHVRRKMEIYRDPISSDDIPPGPFGATKKRTDSFLGTQHSTDQLISKECLLEYVVEFCLVVCFLFVCLLNFVHTSSCCHGENYERGNTCNPSKSIHYS